MNRLPLLLLLVLAVPALATTGYAPEDFVRGFRLLFENKAALQHVELSHEVLATSLQPELSDLRVFNGEGREVPMAIRRMDGNPAPPVRVQLPFFPLKPTAANNDGTRVHITTSAGQHLDVHMDASSPRDCDSILLDASGHGDITELDVRFAQSTDTLVPITITGSEDLIHWTHVADTALLNMTRLGGHVLSQSRVRTTGRTWNYYMLSGRNLNALVSGVDALTGGSHLEVPRRWTTLELRALGDDTYEGMLPPGLPVDALDLRGSENAILGIRVLTSDASGTWRQRQQGILFRITDQNRSIQSAFLPFAPTDRFRLQIQGSMQPLRVGWIARELLFMPQGPGPFTLAVGNRNVRPPADLLTPLLGSDTGNTLYAGEATLGQAAELGGSGGTPSRTPFILWSVLVLGVIVLGLMAWKLSRDVLRKNSE